ncbi:chitin-binding domain protein cbd-1-like [Anopheles ziemanni]|uniref:chitin-binding domain protein cbd-1-like n=1 Tax=Anopheles coustani TaxID=139045 RepID=UPI00265B56C7|nr:chitin-binding domain protein cbd-1-like [Anopheles coustani]XP_058169974.1 chitin-binding domain protein cbd-1-like [Anopheles ziemanni]
MKVVVAILGCLLLVASSDAYNEVCIGVPNLTYVRSPQACYLYYACIDGQAYGYTCPDELWFSLELQRCVPQDESDCDIEQPPELPAAPPRPPSPECTDVDDFTYLPSDTSCQFYYQCIDNFAYLLSCPRGYWFSVSLGRCGNRYEVECDLEVPESTPNPPNPPGNLCFGRPNFSNVRDPQFCHRFYYCLNGSPFPMVCQNGFLFDETAQNCIPEEEAQCNEVPPPAPPTSGICSSVADGQMVLNPIYCNLYYVCVDETAFPSVCPDGEWFDTETQECGQPMDVFCPNGPQTTPTPNVCVDTEDGDYVASPQRCEAYYVCSGGIGYILYCPPGLWFDQVTRECINPAEAICNVPTPPTPNTTPTIPPTIPPTGPPEEGNQMCNGVANNVNLPSPDDCSRFYICFNGGAYPSNCLGGLWFNPETSLCDLPENVDCDVVIPCIDGNAYPQVCSDDLWFSNEQQRCVTKEESDCTLTDPPALPEAPEPEPSPLCAGVSNFRYVAATDSCQWYYQCIDGIAYLISCPLYYWFDENMQRCGTRYDVQCDREGSTTTIIPTPPTVDPLELCDDLPDFTLVPSASLCDRYYSCYQGNPYPQNCLPGLWFNPDTLECDDPENVEVNLPSSLKMKKNLAFYVVLLCCLIGGSLQHSSSSSSSSESNESNGNGRPPWVSTGRPPWVSTGRPPVNRDRCNGVADGTLFPAPNCANFILCEGGRDVQTACVPEGTLFDYERGVCDHPEFVTCYAQENRCTGRVNGTLIPAQECSNFIICMNELETEEVSCVPDGTLFDYQREVCDFPENVLCWESDMCAGRPDGSLAPSRNCSNFFICEDEAIFEEITCQPSGTVFDWEREVCDHPENVKCWESGSNGNSTERPPSSTASPTRPPLDTNVPNDICRGVTVGMIAHPTNCGQYVICVLGQPTVQYCPDDFIFIPELSTCGFGDASSCQASRTWVEVYKRVVSYVH